MYLIVEYFLQSDEMTNSFNYFLRLNLVTLDLVVPTSLMTFVDRQPGQPSPPSPQPIVRQDNS